MKNLVIIIAFFLLTSCETVVDVDLNTAPERLVVDANINWEKGTSGNIQTIILSKSTGYYQPTIPKVSGATVFITNSSNTIFDFIEEPSPGINSGKYTCNNFQPVIGETYTLTIISQGKTYKAVESLIPTPDITDVEQENNLGLNNDEIGVKINFNDAPVIKNYYLLKTEASINLLPYYEVTEDLFNQGNTMSLLYSDPDLTTGNTMTFKLHGISQRYHTFMTLLINASAGSNNGPFQVTPTIVKGNIKNLADTKDLVFGYFRLGETDTYNYVVQ